VTWTEIVFALVVSISTAYLAGRLVFTASNWCASHKWSPLVTEWLGIVVAITTTLAVIQIAEQTAITGNPPYWAIALSVAGAYVAILDAEEAIVVWLNHET
jgi:RNA polymerase subunit RPABC4/transcription elongation factor Spt4